ncbi:heparinase II/III domain-containing protein [Sphingomicrobium marinum]|uniref:heparinase II/III domain-containing protein n=1 Tax=Sphingomicrobium marinum TaxID=1227950 RepID=UPI00223F4EE8|nr:heparinase II/III family protein [Sphingomicrobium marinum]
MGSLATKLSTYRALGLGNVLRVARYRLGLKTGAHPVLKLSGEPVEGPFYKAAERRLPFAPREEWRTSGWWFGKHEVRFGDGIPDWHANPLGDASVRSDLDWHQIPDFNPDIGDIKTVWEASRFDWLLAMATRAAAGDDCELERLNAWLEDWISKNPPYKGANWKCGQEASIRVMHLCLAAAILDQPRAPLPALRHLVDLHLKRIAPTLDYARGQANNHATSEAAALYCGGLLLGAAGERYRKLGHKALEEEARRLILEDGTFSQYSLVYHRVMLDTYCFAELWRRTYDAPAFCDAAYERIAAATRWLAQLVDLESGDGPNFGANDGARLFALTDDGYRDFRPTLQTAAALFLDRRALQQDGPWDRMLTLFGEALPDTPLDIPPSKTFDDGGLHVLGSGKAKATLRYARFDFRPSQADLMHVDLWVDGENILRDDGSYGYAADDEMLGGIASHNSVQFDGKEPMPRVSRFLWGDWIEAETAPVLEARGVATAAARHTDRHGNFHERRVTLHSDRLICEDTLRGPAEQAILRWRLKPGAWTMENGTLTLGNIAIEVGGDEITQIELADGVESRFYLDRKTIPVMKVATSIPAKIRSEIRFQ